MSDFRLTDIATGIWETIYSLFTKIATNFINQISSIFADFIPPFQQMTSVIVDLFQLVVPAVIYCFDAMLLSPATVAFMVAVIIFKITGKFAVWWVKVVLDWWNRIAP